MNMSTANQAYIFLIAVYGGLIIGVIYDIFRVVRSITQSGKWFTAVIDFVFWVLVAFLLFYMLFKVNGGQIRFYTLIGIALGWSLYRLTIGALVVKTLLKIYEVILAIVSWPIKILIKFWKWVIGKLPVKRNKEDHDNINIQSQKTLKNKEGF